MRKKISVKSFHFPKSFSPDKHTCPACPEYFPYIIVLSGILFHRIKDSSPAKRIPQPVNVSTRSPCILKHERVSERQYLWLASANLFIFFHQIKDGFNPARR